jgi:hypothetical protein
MMGNTIGRKKGFKHSEDNLLSKNWKENCLDKIKLNIKTEVK